MRICIFSCNQCVQCAYGSGLSDDFDLFRVFHRHRSRTTLKKRKKTFNTIQNKQTNKQQQHTLAISTKLTSPSSRNLRHPSINAPGSDYNEIKKPTFKQFLKQTTKIIPAMQHLPTTFQVSLHQPPTTTNNNIEQQQQQQQTSITKHKSRYFFEILLIIAFFNTFDKLNRQRHFDVLRSFAQHTQHSNEQKKTEKQVSICAQNSKSNKIHQFETFIIII
jgi:hypothetical protein